MQDIAEIAAGGEKEDQYDTFGRYVASQLRELPLREFISVQNKIQNLITAARLSCLDDERSIPVSPVFFQSDTSSSSTENFASGSSRQPIDPDPEDYAFQVEDIMTGGYDTLTRALVGICRSPKSTDILP